MFNLEIISKGYHEYLKTKTMALDLKKLDKKVTDLLNIETEESLNEWVDNYSVKNYFNSIKDDLNNNQQLKLLSMLATNIHTTDTKLTSLLNQISNYPLK